MTEAPERKDKINFLGYDLVRGNRTTRRAACSSTCLEALLLEGEAQPYFRRTG